MTFRSSGIRMCNCVGVGVLFSLLLFCNHVRTSVTWTTAPVPRSTPRPSCSAVGVSRPGCHCPLYQQTRRAGGGGGGGGGGGAAAAAAAATTAATTTTASSSKRQERILLQTVPFFGQVYRLGGDKNDNNRSFVDQMGVPTFVMIEMTSCMPSSSTAILDASKTKPICRSIPDIQPGPALMIEQVLSPRMCQEIIQACETLGFADYQAGKNHHGALQIVVSSTMADQMAQALQPHVNLTAIQALQSDLDHATAALVTKPVPPSTAPSTTCTSMSTSNLQYAGINRRWRVYRYAPGGVQSFAPHIDAGFPPSGITPGGDDLIWDTSSGKTVSRLTLLLYLNDQFRGGATIFYKPYSQSTAATTRAVSETETVSAKVTNHTPWEVLTAVRPVTGAILLFPQAVGEPAVEYARQYWPLHEGSPVLVSSSHTPSQPKYVIRSDILFNQAD